MTPLLNLGHPINKGLVGYWPFQEGGGSHAIDLAMRQRAVLTNGAMWAQSPMGSSGSFDGANDYAAVQPTSLNSITGQILSITAWIYPLGWGGSDRGRIIDKINGTGAGFVFHVDNSNSVGNLSFGINDTTTGTSYYWSNTTNIISLNMWQHVGVVYTYGVPVFYVNGRVYPSSVTFSSTIISANTTQLNIGGRSSGADRGFAGRIAMVRLYNRVLTPSEVVLCASPLAGVLLPRHLIAVPATAGGAVKAVNGLAIASVKTFDGLAIASVKTINGLAR